MSLNLTEIFTNLLVLIELCFGTFKHRLREVLALLPHDALVGVQRPERFQEVVKSTLRAYAADTDGREVAAHCQKRMVTVLQGQVV